MSRYREEKEPLGFWGTVSAVALGILLASAIMGLVGLLLAKAATERMVQDIQSMTQQAPPAPVQRSRQAPTPRSTNEPIRLLYGPSYARAHGEPYACIGGYVATRLPDGWDQVTPTRRCIPRTAPGGG